MGLHGCIMDLQAALKKYQTEQRSKGDALDKCQAELKKLRKKSQGSKNPQKYSDKELQVGLTVPLRPPALPQQGKAPPSASPSPVFTMGLSRDGESFQVWQGWAGFLERGPMSLSRGVVSSLGKDAAMGLGY